ncbi:hypothetical protein CEW91_06445 [Idiomarina piscisalsi]|jgi:uncharacterized protein YeaC (DUF1315 family)|uniref:DUF1315 domain-containing protein n=1 Tax=Idiomarina piscisalsi TaxID=1096243 RepID=A0ABN5AQ95_9GAMM|nr:DUF1315 family protein [Idiomarina piscisalsi]ASG65799.1 hypothetical protein CEW91_06445 [Idiomarina piscisalsi]
MQFDDLINSMTPEVYERLVQSVETGKWPDGNKLTEEQRENSLQLVMAYQAKFANSDEAYTVGPDGNIISKSKRELKDQFRTGNDTASIARFKLDN